MASRGEADGNASSSSIELTPRVVVTSSSGRAIKSFAAQAASSSDRAAAGPARAAADEGSTDFSSDDETSFSTSSAGPAAARPAPSRVAPPVLTVSEPGEARTKRRQGADDAAADEASWSYSSNNDPEQQRAEAQAQGAGPRRGRSPERRANLLGECEANIKVQPAVRDILLYVCEAGAASPGKPTADSDLAAENFSNVFVAPDVDEVIRVLHTASFDLLLLDARSGTERLVVDALRRIRAARRSMPHVLLLTREREVAALQRLVDAGCDDYLHVPYVRSVLGTRIRRLAPPAQQQKLRARSRSVSPAPVGSLASEQHDDSSSVGFAKKSALRWKLSLVQAERRRAAELEAANRGLAANLASVEHTLRTSNTPLALLLERINALNKSRAGTEEGGAELQREIQELVAEVATGDAYAPRIAELLRSNSAEQVEESSASANVKSRMLKRLNSHSKWVLEEFSQTSRAQLSVSRSSHQLISTTSLLQRLDFSLADKSSDEMIELVLSMFEEQALLAEFAISRTVMRAFLEAVRALYHDQNPYHNFAHAIDVTQMVYFFLTTGGLGKTLSALESFGLLVAALGHDLNHPGQNNQYLISTQAPLALVYNDVSVLENHHASLLFRICQNDTTNILASLTAEQRAAVREVIVNCILSTDMARHFEIVSKFSALLEQKDIGSFASKEERKLLMSFVLHAADVSNPVRPLPVFRRWAERVQEEFFQQGDLERERGLNVAPIMNREQGSLPALEVGFIKFVVQPLYAEVSRALPAIGELLMTNLSTNFQCFQKMLEFEEMAKSASEPV